jgi:hypothetical protein
LQAHKLGGKVPCGKDREQTRVVRCTLVAYYMIGNKILAQIVTVEYEQLSYQSWVILCVVACLNND